MPSSTRATAATRRHSRARRARETGRRAHSLTAQCLLPNLKLIGLATQRALERRTPGAAPLPRPPPCPPAPLYRPQAACRPSRDSGSLRDLVLLADLPGRPVAPRASEHDPSSPSVERPPCEAPRTRSPPRRYAAPPRDRVRAHPGYLPSTQTAGATPCCGQGPRPVDEPALPDRCLGPKRGSNIAAIVSPLSANGCNR
jgi:hypothetical protein